MLNPVTRHAGKRAATWQEWDGITRQVQLVARPRQAGTPRLARRGAPGRPAAIPRCRFRGAHSFRAWRRRQQRRAPAAECYSRPRRTIRAIPFPRFSALGA